MKGWTGSRKMREGAREGGKKGGREDRWIEVLLHKAQRATCGRVFARGKAFSACPRQSIL
jgi:hypothetical protein